MLLALNMMVHKRPKVRGSEKCGVKFSSVQLCEVKCSEVESSEVKCSTVK